MQQFSGSVRFSLLKTFNLIICIQGMPDYFPLPVFPGGAVVEFEGVFVEQVWSPEGSPVKTPLECLLLSCVCLRRFKAHSYMTAVYGFRSIQLWMYKFIITVNPTACLPRALPKMSFLIFVFHSFDLFRSDTIVLSYK